MKAALVALALACATVPAFPQALPVPCSDSERLCAFAAAKASPVKRLAYWRSRFGVPTEDRVGVAPPELVKYLALDAIWQGIPAKPRAAADHPEVMSDLKAALAELPLPIRQRLSGRFAGVYLLENFGGSGFTDVIGDESGQEFAAFVVLDPVVLEARTANAWATWKESSPFVPDPRYSLRATLEDAGHDTRRQAIQYILLHELGHVVSVEGDFHPSWNGLPAQAVPQGRYPFFDVSWSFDGGKAYVNRFAGALPETKRLRYYFGPMLAANEMAATYEHLEHTAFPTLYAATIPGDDFAESFANYVHVVMLHKPFEIAISEDGRVVERYGSCWEQPRCAAKRKILEEFLR